MKAAQEAARRKAQAEAQRKGLEDQRREQEVRVKAAQEEARRKAQEEAQRQGLGIQRREQMARMKAAQEEKRKADAQRKADAANAQRWTQAASMYQKPKVPDQPVNTSSSNSHNQPVVNRPAGVFAADLSDAEVRAQIAAVGGNANMDIKQARAIIHNARDAAYVRAQEAAILKKQQEEARNQAGQEQLHEQMARTAAMQALQQAELASQRPPSISAGLWERLPQEDREKIAKQYALVGENPTNGGTPSSQVPTNLLRWLQPEDRMAAKGKYDKLRGPSAETMAKVGQVPSANTNTYVSMNDEKSWWQKALVGLANGWNNAVTGAQTIVSGVGSVAQALPGYLKETVVKPVVVGAANLWTKFDQDVGQPIRDTLDAGSQAYGNWVSNPNRPLDLLNPNWWRQAGATVLGTMADSLQSIADPNRNPRTAAFHHNFKNGIQDGVQAWGDIFNMWKETASYTTNAIAERRWADARRGVAGLTKEGGWLAGYGFLALGQLALSVVSTPIRLLTHDIPEFAGAIEERKKGEDRGWDVVFTGANLAGDIIGTYSLANSAGIVNKVNSVGADNLGIGMTERIYRYGDVEYVYKFNPYKKAGLGYLEDLEGVSASEFNLLGDVPDEVYRNTNIQMDFNRDIARSRIEPKSFSNPDVFEDRVFSFIEAPNMTKVKNIFPNWWNSTLDNSWKAIINGALSSIIRR